MCRSHFRAYTSWHGSLTFVARHCTPAKPCTGSARHLHHRRLVAYIFGAVQNYSPNICETRWFFFIFTRILFFYIARIKVLVGTRLPIPGACNFHPFVSCHSHALPVHLSFFAHALLLTVFWVETSCRTRILIASCGGLPRARGPPRSGAQRYEQERWDSDRKT